MSDSRRRDDGEQDHDNSPREMRSRSRSRDRDEYNNGNDNGNEVVDYQEETGDKNNDNDIVEQTGGTIYCANLNYKVTFNI